MPVADFVDFKQTWRVKGLDESRVRGRRRCTFHFPLFVAINRRNEKQTTVKIIYSSH